MGINFILIRRRLIRKWWGETIELQLKIYQNDDEKKVWRNLKGHKHKPNLNRLKERRKNRFYKWRWKKKYDERYWHETNTTGYSHLHMWVTPFTVYHDIKTSLTRQMDFLNISLAFIHRHNTTQIHFSMFWLKKESENRYFKGRNATRLAK